MFGDTLRAARKDAGLTQQDLAELLGVNREYISSMERDDDSERVVRLRKALDALGLTLVVVPKGARPATLEQDPPTEATSRGDLRGEGL